MKASYWRYSRSGKKWQTLNNLQVALKHACVKRCKAKKYWGETILLSQYLEKCWGECPHCPYGVGAYGAQQLPNISAHVLWPNGWMGQDATWCGGRPRPRRHCVRRQMSIAAKRSPISATAEHLSTVLMPLIWPPCVAGADIIFYHCGFFSVVQGSWLSAL